MGAGKCVWIEVWRHKVSKFLSDVLDFLFAVSHLLRMSQKLGWDHRVGRFMQSGEFSSIAEVRFESTVGS